MLNINRNVNMDIVPSFKSTYYRGATLHLYLYDPPNPPKDPTCTLEDRGKALLQIKDRYKTSIERRISLPSTHPDISITLDEPIQTGNRHFSHIWTARVRARDISFPELVVAKIFDPVYYDDSDDLVWLDPFSRSDLSVWNEVNSYQRLASMQGKNVPLFYNHFVASLGETHQHRTVNALVMEYINGKDISKIVPRGTQKTVCTEHLDALYTKVLQVHFAIWDLGVQNHDMVPRNVILRVSDSQSRCTCRRREPFCSEEGCPFRSEICCNSEHILVVIVDFEVVKFGELCTLPISPTFMKEAVQQRKKSWLHGLAT
ncbi:hypothetical protein VKT23_005273 [Stygiomarasmius scandens]|uniref:Protein kinase domain-containing protein n=1 Tax=Marasmiellus scandens TaxID=2682957 RepID=A0ABR1JR42_9AGAR